MNEKSVDLSAVTAPTSHPSNPLHGDIKAPLKNKDVCFLRLDSKSLCGDHSHRRRSLVLLMKKAAAAESRFYQKAARWDSWRDTAADVAAMTTGCVAKSGRARCRLWWREQSWNAESLAEVHGNRRATGSPAASPASTEYWAICPCTEGSSQQAWSLWQFVVVYKVIHTIGGSIFITPTPWLCLSLAVCFSVGFCQKVRGQ